MATLKDFYTKNHKSFKMSKPIKELQECFGHNINYNFCYLPFMFISPYFTGSLPFCSVISFGPFLYTTKHEG